MGRLWVERRVQHKLMLRMVRIVGAHVRVFHFYHMHIGGHRNSIVEQRGFNMYERFYLAKQTAK